MKKRLSLISIGLFALSTFAQSLEECRTLAREHYPAIRQYRLIEQAQAYNLSNATKGWLPQVTLTGQAHYQSAAAKYPDALASLLEAQGVSHTGMTKAQYKLGVSLSQTLWDGGSTQANKQVTRATTHAEQLKVDVTLHEVQTKVDDLYFGILLLDRRIALLQTPITLLDNNLKRIQSFVRNGTAMQADCDLLEAERLTCQQRLEQALSTRQSYRLMLELFIGQTLTDEVLCTPAPCPLPHLRSAHPELTRLQAEEDIVRTKQEALRTTRLPRLHLFAEGYYGYPGLNMFKNMTSTQPTLNGLVGVKLTWNISALYTLKNNLSKLHTEQQAIALQRDVFLFHSDLQTTQETGEIKRLEKALAHDQRIVDLRQRVRQTAEAQLANGVIALTDLLQKITDETSARLTLSTHEIELLQTTYRLKNRLNP